MDKYAIYLRKSRADAEAEARGELETLARHEKTLLELAQKMKIHIEKVYKEVVSGETIVARPIMQILLAEVQQGVWSGVLVMEVERLARGDGIDQQIVLNTFKQGNTKIITPIKTYDPNDEFDEEYFEFGLFMSRREYKTINRRIQRGRVASVKEGKTVISTPPYGYNKVKIPNDKGFTLEPNEEAKVVKLIFDMYLQGKGMTTIGSELDKLNIKPRHRDTWSRSTINDILSNPVYIGKIRWAYRKETKAQVNGELKKVRKINHNCYYIDGIHDGIIDEDIFYKAQEIRKNNITSSTKKDLSLKNPLSGLLYCSICKSMMTRVGKNPHNKHDIIRCPNNNCCNVSAPIFLVEQKIISELSDWLLNYEIKIDRNINQNNKNQVKIIKSSIRTIKHEIEQLDKQISQTYDLLERLVYTEEVFDLRKKELSVKRESYTKNLLELEKKAKDEEMLSETKEILPQSKKLLYEYEQVESVQKRNEILRSLLHRVEYLKSEKNKKGQVNNDNFEITIMPKLPHWVNSDG